MEKYINKIINADCLDILRDFPDKSIDLIICDPPYGIDFIPGREKAKEKYGRKAIKNDELMGEAISSYLKPIFEEAYRVLKDDSVIFVFCGYELYYLAKPILEAGFKKKAVLVWVKNNFGMGFHFRRQHEDCIVGFKGKPKTPKHAISDVIFAKRANGKTMIHSCEKPVDLIKRLIPQYSKPGDIILDPFCGSGSTCVAAKQIGRRYIGIELDEKYIKPVEERLEATVLDKEQLLIEENGTI